MSSLSMTSCTMEDVTLTWWAGVGARAGRSEDEFTVYDQLYYRRMSHLPGGLA